jgi:hypothetical protein
LGVRAPQLNRRDDRRSGVDACPQEKPARTINVRAIF